MNEEATKDFFKVVLVFMACVIAIMIIIPINIKWLLVGIVLVIMASALQYFWNKHFKR